MSVTRADVPHPGQSSHHSAWATGNGGVTGPITHWPSLGRGRLGAGWGVLILCGCASAQGGGESVMLMCNRLQPCGVKCLFSLIHCLGV